ncbi:MAG: tyrosine-type recombinase/integrase [Planctomycetota bacterium]|nr:tyrosine-type recombinase/integrase [Planctomycetota bacterium]
MRKGSSGWRRVKTGRYVFRAPFHQNGKWRYRKVDTVTEKVTCETLEIPGKSSRRQAQNTIEELAANVAKEEERQRLRPEDRDPEVVTLRWGLDRWLAMKRKELRDSTYMDYVYSANVYARHLGEDSVVSTIDYRALESFLKTWIADRKGLTKRKHLRQLGQFFKWCVKQNYHRYNPTADFEIPVAWKKSIKKSKRRKQALAHEECQELLEASREPYLVDFRPDLKEKKRMRLVETRPPAELYLIVLTGLLSGLRKGTILNLRWEHLDLEREILDVPDDLTKNSEPLIVPLHPELAGEYRRYRLSRGRTPKKGERIFSIDDIKTPWRSALKRAGLSDRGFRFHDTRTTFIMALDRSPIPRIASEMLAGHSPGTVNDEYGFHLTAEELREHLVKLPWFFPKHVAAEQAVTQ